MKVTIAELRALAKRAGVEMWYADGIGEWCISGDFVYHEFRASGNGCDMNKRKAKLLLLGIIAEREGLL